ncbi:MAG TPA: M56 family metallopeptidase [Pirellulales bacterium]|jgi:beta-lactamase regulating signal transducer with metallopeptidase domain|nr:M56 family metallopeptidase [Pirellulales bacterium]
MSSFDAVARHWLAWIVAASWQLALLILVVAGVCCLARGASPRLRHGLWLLVLAKIILPPGLTTPLSVGRWAVAPLLETTGLTSIVTAPLPTSDRLENAGTTPGSEHAGQSLAARHLPLPMLLMALWIVGGLLFWVMVAWRYALVARILRAAHSIDEGPVRVALERIALAIPVAHVPDLLVTETITVPFLFGVFRPRIVLPAALLQSPNDAALEAVLTHELIHWKRRDTWIGWLQVLGQSIFWFHPFLWWANRQLRHERECVCDEMVLRLGRITPRSYGQSLLHVLTESRARSLVAGSLVGVFEPGANLQNRLEEIMNYQPAKRQFNGASRLALALFAVLFLPMAPGISGTSVAAEDGAAAQPDAAATPYPRIIKTTPERGATDVDPALTEISVTFDRDMDRGMSWTGGPPLFPPTEESRPPHWIDARTCVLPVSLEKGAQYQVGINSPSYQNFRAKMGMPVPASVIAFTTVGATEAIKRRVRIPKIVSLSPENGATDVDPATKSLKVTFDMPMGGGMSWTGSGPNFPKESPDGKKPGWSKDGKTCTLPVLLEAGHEYELGLNSLNHINFQSKWGVPLEPVGYKFHTTAAK